MSEKKQIRAQWDDAGEAEIDMAGEILSLRIGELSSAGNCCAYVNDLHVGDFMDERVAKIAAEAEAIGLCYKIIGELSDLPEWAMPAKA